MPNTDTSLDAVVRKLVKEELESERLLSLSTSDWVGLFAAVVGAFLGALAAWWLMRRYRSRDLVYAMHREFYGTDMADIRSEAGDRLPAILHLTLDKLDSVPDHKKNTDIWKMIRFYERLAVLISSKEVQVRTVSELFAGSYIWWYHVYFYHATRKITWNTKDHLDSLYCAILTEMDERISRQRSFEWLRCRCEQSSSQLQTRRDNWIANGERGREEHLAKAIHAVVEREQPWVNCSKHK